MSPNVEQITQPAGLGEGPFWNARQQTLYYVDIIGASVHSYNNVTKEHHSVKLGNYILFYLLLNTPQCTGL